MPERPFGSDSQSRALISGGCGSVLMHNVLSFGQVMSQMPNPDCGDRSCLRLVLW